MFKRILFLAFIISLFPGILNAAAIYQNDNQSAESIRMLNRFASTDVDAAYFNPAGLSFMKNDGLYLYVSDQMIFQKREVKDSSTVGKIFGKGEPVTMESMASTYGYPDLYAVWKKDALSLYAHFCFLGAGAYADYEDGSTSFNGMAFQYANSVVTGGGDSLTSLDAATALKAYMVMLGSTAGASYRILPMVSVAGGVRYVYGLQDKDFSIKYNHVIGATTVDYKTAAPSSFTDTDIRSVADGHAAGFIGSVNVKPAEQLLIAVKYEYYTPLTLENNAPKTLKAPATMQTPVDMLAAFRKGSKTNTPLPMSITSGISFMITEELRTEASFSYYFNKLADWGKGQQGSVIAGKEINDYIDNSWAAGLAFEYAFMPNLKASLGGTYSASGMNKKVRDDLNYNPDVLALGTGFTYGINEAMDFTFGFMSCFYQDQKGTNFDTSVDPTANNQELTVPYTISFAIGLTYRIAM